MGVGSDWFFDDSTASQSTELSKKTFATEKKSNCSAALVCAAIIAHSVRRLSLEAMHHGLKISCCIETCTIMGRICMPRHVGLPAAAS